MIDAGWWSGVRRRGFGVVVADNGVAVGRAEQIGMPSDAEDDVGFEVSKQGSHF